MLQLPFNFLLSSEYYPFESYFSVTDNSTTTEVKGTISFYMQIMVFGVLLIAPTMFTNGKNILQLLFPLT